MGMAAFSPMKILGKGTGVQELGIPPVLVFGLRLLDGLR